MNNDSRARVSTMAVRRSLFEIDILVLELVGGENYKLAMMRSWHGKKRRRRLEHAGRKSGDNIIM